MLTAGWSVPLATGPSPALHVEIISLSAFCEELGLPASRVVTVRQRARGGPITVVVEREESAMQTSGTAPQLTKGGKKINGKPVKWKRGC